MSYKGFYGEWKPSSDQSDSTICDKYDLKACTSVARLHASFFDLV